MKTSLLLIICSFALTSAISQRVKYNELILTFNGMTDEEMRNELKDYMTVDNTEPNLYFRLATIYQKVYKNADPLTDFDLAIANANEASSRFLQASRYVDAK